MVFDYENVCTVQFVFVCNRFLYGFYKSEGQESGHYYMENYLLVIPLFIK